MEKRIGRIPKNQAPSLVLRLVTEYFDGYGAKAAEHFGVTRQAVNAWVKRGWMPARYALKASEATNGAITVEQFMEEYLKPSAGKVGL